MKISFKFLMFCILGIGGGIYFWYWNSARKDAEQLEYQRSLEKEVRDMSKVIRAKNKEVRDITEEANALKANASKRTSEQEREWNAAKGDKKKTLKLLQDFAVREDQRLRIKVAEINQWLGALDEDNGILSDALVAVEKEAKEKEELSRKRRQKFYANAERVMLIFQNENINALAEKHLGEDLSAQRAAYYEKVNAEIRIHNDQIKGLKANRDAYHKSIEGISEAVDKKNEAAGRRIWEANDSAQRNLSGLEARKRKLEKDRDLLRKGIQTGTTRTRLTRLESALDAVDREIRMARQQCEATKAQLAHLEATTTESKVRKQVDVAQETRQTADNDVQAEAQHERAVFLLAESFERDSLGKIRTAIQNRRDILVKSKKDILEKLEFMRASIGNADLLNADELEHLREQFVKKVTDDGTEDATDSRKRKRP